MKRVLAVWTICVLVSLGSFAALLVEDRRLGLPLPYAFPLAFAAMLVIGRSRAFAGAGVPRRAWSSSMRRPSRPPAGGARHDRRAQPHDRRRGDAGPDPDGGGECGLCCPVLARGGAIRVRAGVVVDEPAVFTFAGRRPWKPANYSGNYAGPITWRRALAESRNVSAVKVAAWAGIDRVARLWESASGQRLTDVPPSLVLGAIGATPAEVARAYAIFATGGATPQLRTVRAVIAEGRIAPTPARAVQVASPGPVALVSEMLRAVFDEGTARGARALGFTTEAAGKTGTTNDLRDAWFAGFAGDLLTVVWVGCDDNRPVGLTGAQAALPMWTDFMKRAVQAGSGAQPR